MDLRLPRRIRKTRLAFHAADWEAFQQQTEPLLDQPVEAANVEQLNHLLSSTILQAAKQCIPRSARADPKPWGLDPDLREAIN
jgi:hypothetical protein